MRDEPLLPDMMLLKHLVSERLYERATLSRLGRLGCCFMAVNHRKVLELTVRPEDDTVLFRPLAARVVQGTTVPADVAGFCDDVVIIHDYVLQEVAARHLPLAASGAVISFHLDGYRSRDYVHAHLVAGRLAMVHYLRERVAGESAPNKKRLADGHGKAKTCSHAAGFLHIAEHACKDVVLGKESEDDEGDGFRALTLRKQPFPGSRAECLVDIDSGLALTAGKGDMPIHLYPLQGHRNQTWRLSDFTRDTFGLRPSSSGDIISRAGPSGTLVVGGKNRWKDTKRPQGTTVLGLQQHDDAPAMNEHYAQDIEAIGGVEAGSQPFTWDGPADFEMCLHPALPYVLFHRKTTTATDDEALDGGVLGIRHLLTAVMQFYVDNQIKAGHLLLPVGPSFGYRADGLVTDLALTDTKADADSLACALLVEPARFYAGSTGDAEAWLRGYSDAGKKAILT